MSADTLQSRALAAPADSERPGAVVPPMEDVYAAHFQFVFRCLRGLGVPDAGLDDALQDVFLVVQRKLERFDGKGDLKTWLYAIALRVARRYRVRAAKDARKFVPADADAEVEGDENPRAPRFTGAPVASDVEHELERGERLDLARRALDSLDEDKREVFVLACVEQMSAPEIARITGHPVNTIYSRIRAARLAFSGQVARLERAHRRRLR